jgi:hypothetical protein
VHSSFYFVHLQYHETSLEYFELGPRYRYNKQKVAKFLTVIIFYEITLKLFLITKIIYAYSYRLDCKLSA